ncbi:putative phosphoribosylaminoimidazole-succinocarboxamide synthase [Thozetella sp. PMI_491]|nr:putative phosphoribosylaminoimidazole-succinocarboxamide synthase [Thozetella sp. PMI_491]
MATAAVAKVDLGSLKLRNSGKVREIYDVDENTILFTTSDRISAYDVIMNNGVPGKGIVLTLATKHWFDVLSAAIPTLRTHFVSLLPPAALTAEEKAQVRGRSMLVRRLVPFKIEAIVRGYITGSAWNEYVKSGTVHGEPVPAGLQQCAKFPEPLYTPSTKAELGDNDENITRDKAAEIVGAQYAARIERLAINLYEAGAAYAAERGIIIADTKFEFALDPATDEIVLIDEVLTPDSSRFWPADKYEVGRDQDSFDKQFLRNWLVQNKLKGKPDVTMPEDIVAATSERYLDAFQKLTGKTLEQALQDEGL